jgi:DNA-binding transcriptional regulator YiaG
MKWTPEAVKELRERLGFSQAALAKRLGVAVSTVSRWETGNFSPTPMAAKALENLARRGKSQP